MTDMPTAPAHAKTARRDHLLWAVAIIALFALYDIWGSWTEVGNKSGFAHGTGWTLTVIVEVYGGCALFAWLANSPGLRSRRFAMWSAIAALALSLVGQASSHLTARNSVPPALVVVFVSVLPVIILALIAVLVHLRHLDRSAAAAAAECARAEEAEAQREAAEVSELAALRAELEAHREALATAQADRDAAQQQTAQTAAEAEQDAAAAAAKIEALNRKLAAQKPSRTRAKAANAGRRTAPDAAPRADAGTQLPADFDARTEALEMYLANPQISGKDLAAAVGMKERWGQLRKAEFGAERSGERSPDQADALNGQNPERGDS